MRKLVLIPCLLLLLLSGCGLTLGPKAENNYVFAKYKDIVGRVAENKKVKVAMQSTNPETKEVTTYVEEIDIGGFNVISPDLVTPKPVKEK